VVAGPSNSAGMCGIIARSTGFRTRVESPRRPASRAPG
jgi:hypothetical protein